MCQHTFTVLLTIYSGVVYCKILEGGNTCHDIQEHSVPTVSVILRITCTMLYTLDQRTLQNFYTLNDLHYMEYTNDLTLYRLQSQCDDAVKIFMQVHENN